uniref:phospholipase A2 n=2 Tax=Timema TaxID=61471 RepID=A0A7R9DYA4_9NEOP|nr:unnamed protein product [Timema monikensis]
MDQSWLVSPVKMFSCRGMLVPALLVLAAVVVADGALLIMSDGLSRMVTLKERGQLCSVHNNKSKIKRMMAKSDSVMVHRISSEELEELMESCTQKASSGQRGFIYPGTKWCGPGNIAKHFDDVGRYGEEDKCCREHDHCPKQLGAGQCRYGICNKSLFTRQVN